METKEKIKVYIKIVDGKTVCLCSFHNKKCKHNCDVDMVERDKFYGWKDTFRRDKYGKSK